MLRKMMMGMANDPVAVFAALGDGAGAGGGGNAAAAGAAGDGGAGAAGAAAGGAAAAAGGDPGAGGGTQPDTRPWYEQRTWGDQGAKNHLLKSGYNMAASADEALELALKGEASAVAKLGKSPSALLDAPAQGQKVGDWLKANGRALGVPEDAGKYDLAMPKDLPEGVPLDDALLADAKAWGHANGLPPEIMQGMVDFYGAKIGGRVAKMATDAAIADTALRETLQAEWGQNYAQNMDLAKRAFQTLAVEMKMSPEQAQLTASMLEKGLGSATLTKFMHHLAGKMGEDTLAMPRGGNSHLMQLGQAQSRKAQIMAPMTGEMALAARAGNQARVSELQKELTGLNTIMAQFQG